MRRTGLLFVALVFPLFHSAASLPFRGDEEARNSTGESFREDPRLELECERQNGFPNSLSCSESEWFVQGYSDFREDLADSGLLPLGQVHCCTPKDDKVDAVHVKCSARRGVENCAFLRHKPENLSSFLVGFSGSLRIDDIEYAPRGAAVCCDAIAEMRDGSRRYISPCDCLVTEEVLCPRTNNGLYRDRVMTGFLVDTNIGVPLTPAECCSMCLGEVVPPDSDCPRYDHCSSRGVCHGGFCECVDGYSGMDCSLRRNLTLEELFRNYSWDVLVCSASGTIVFLWVFFFVRRGRERSHPEEGVRRGSSRDRLLDYIELIDEDSDNDTESSAGEGEGEQSEDEEKGEVLRNVAGDESAKDASDGCVICMSSKKLVVLVPCGHSSICRKCSRRLDTCPFCRQPIIKRQKIYFAGN
ncbi:hypothetical protein HOP50_01g00330 [Chloropicon primus]|uniref:RING-type domain-containing protein n=1 Tax=Chloropicon primus TaxID=1764295 RepID=A0A5B8MBS7_9CHLO|nr:hypothetical protein A3770_01p00420 [Chloropicon primus]UPQ96743.1 hypothetical protein HOP50_01g00330 [Chloropicon primus]|eukprot:QDZ17524.1 hypothetical protein A3770_01p00420 [Chloropicon primus]